MITLASEAGRRGLPYEAVYCASKFGQVGFTRALDHELREQGIRCTNVCPGGVATDFALERRAAGGRQDVLPGMMTAEDVAEVVVFVLERPRRLPDPRDGVPADDGGELGMSDGDAVKWGIISTAHINRLVIPGRTRRRRSSSSASRAATRRGPRRTRASGRSRAPTARTRSCSPTRRSRPSTSRCRTRCTASGRSRRSRPGKHVLCEKPLSRASRGGRGGVRRGRARRADPLRGVHVAPQPADGASSRRSSRTGRSASCGSCARRSATRSTTRTTSACGPDVEGGALMDVGCYCVSGSRLLAGEPESVFGAAWFGRDGHRLGLRGDDALPGRRARRSSTAARRCPTATSSR